MYLKKRLFAGLLELALLCTLFSGCAARKAERYDVLASTAPVRAMTAALLDGTDLSCGLVVTESVSCLHDYTLTVAQMEKLGQADVVVLNGLGLEDFMEDALRTAKHTITASDGVETLPGEDGEDPHIWLEPTNCIQMCRNIAAGLSDLYPDKQTLIGQNLLAVTAEYEAAQAEASRLAYARKSEVDPAEFQRFLDCLNTLTPKETEIFNLYLQGKTTKEIQQLAHINENTLKYHNRNLYGKLGVKSRKQLLMYAALMNQTTKKEDPRS